MKPITLVLAGNITQYNQWLHEYVASEDKQFYRYGASPANIRGLLFNNVIVIGTFWDDFSNAADMYELALTLVRK